MHPPESWYLKFERPVSFVHPLNRCFGGTGTLADASSICDVKWFLYLTDIETSLARFVFSQAPLFSLSYTLRLEPGSYRYFGCLIGSYGKFGLLPPTYWRYSDSRLLGLRYMMFSGWL